MAGLSRRMSAKRMPITCSASFSRRHEMTERRLVMNCMPGLAAEATKAVQLARPVDELFYSTDPTRRTVR